MLVTFYRMSNHVVPKVTRTETLTIDAKHAVAVYDSNLFRRLTPETMSVEVDGVPTTVIASRISGTECDSIKGILTRMMDYKFGALEVWEDLYEQFVKQWSRVSVVWSSEDLDAIHMAKDELSPEKATRHKR